MPTVTRDRDELTEALRHLSFAAQRCTPAVGTPEFPTPWDKAHRRIDDHLTLLGLAS